MIFTISQQIQHRGLVGEIVLRQMRHDIDIIKISNIDTEIKLPQKEYPESDFVLWESERSDKLFCYYVFIHRRNIGDKEFRSLCYNLKHSYYKKPICDLVYWHHGCTYAERLGKDRAKFGCDYNHYWDQGRVYDTDMIFSEFCRTVDDIFNLYPDISVM